MSKILMVAYFYPPKGGAGVQRTTKFAKYLSRLGNDVYVLTVKDSEKGIVDKSLTHDIENGIKVYRTDIKEPALLDRLSGTNHADVKNSEVSSVKKPSGLKRKVRNICKKIFLDIYNLFYMPDDKKGWIPFAVEEGIRIVKEEEIDILYTTSGPYTAHIIGCKIAEKVNVKWIADFRDPWASNPFVSYGFTVQKIFNRLESRVIEKADSIISVSQPIVDDFIRRYPLKDKQKFSVITNGFDEDDFKGLDLESSNRNDRFTIVYNGTIYGKRSPEKILDAVNNLIAAGKIPQEKIAVKFIGPVGNEHIGIINHYKNLYPQSIFHSDYVPHRESLNELCSANALLLLIDESPGSEGILTGKIFEYIRSGKPIIGLVPDGAAKDVIIKTNTGYAVHPLDIKKIEEVILELYCKFENKEFNINQNWGEIEKYSRENLTNKLFEVMKIS